MLLPTYFLPILHNFTYIFVLKLSFISRLAPTTIPTTTTRKTTTQPGGGTSDGGGTSGGITHPDGTQSTEITTSVDGMDMNNFQLILPIIRFYTCYLVVS